MQIVIEIPDRILYGVKSGITRNGSVASRIVLDAVKNGTVLQKGHGALKDVDKIEEAFWDNNLIDTNMDSLDNGESNKMRRAMIRTMHLDVPTMVEADEGCGDDCEYCEWATCPKMEVEE